MPLSRETLKTKPSSAPLLVGQIDSQQTIADRMEALAIELRTLSDESVQSIPSQEAFLGLAAKIYQARRKVDKIFGLQGFAVTPGWDIMLDLYQAKIKGKAISVTSACIGGACPATTGLRWLQVLENRDFVRRMPDPEDKRRVVVELTDGGRDRVERALTVHL